MSLIAASMNNASCGCFCHLGHIPPLECHCNCNKFGTYQMSHNDEQIKNISKRIEKLEESFSVQLIHNKCCREINEILSNTDSNISLRIKKLEELNRKCFENNTLKIIDDKFKKLEETQKEHLDKLAELSMKINKIRSECHVAFEIRNEKPHKCPVCDGEGSQLKELNEKIAEFERLPSKLAIVCNACQGKGIVWK
jgi:uncharacterized coiled-coil protein SlyX